ncbi:MAG: hypothetical protein P8R54_32470 [Myxococcota bacterium]|nr:hypothetical protein [Myxococcota bacterium]
MKKTIIAIIAALGMALSGAAEAGWQDGMVSITNARSDGVRVMIDRSYVGSVQPTDAEAFTLSPGRHHVLVTCSKGYTLAEETITIDPFEAEAMTVQAQAAALSMRNSAGTALFIEVDGEHLATLAPNEQSSVRMPAGAHKIKATYRQHDRTHKLSAKNIQFSPGQTETVQFSPVSTGLIDVTNPFGQTARVRINGQDLGSIRAGKSKLIESPLGPVRIQLLINSRVVASERLSVRRYHDASFHAQQSPPPPAYSDGELELSNHRSGSVKVYIDGRLSGSIPSWSERTFTLALGAHQLKVVSANNSVLYNRMIEINRHDETEIELLAQSGSALGTSACSTSSVY